jgi:2-polyprenyl-3-methyl-5-hydroxy-6-metoxy-1,4-benzoquinol methylase
MKENSEVQRLEMIAQNSRYAAGVNTPTVKYSAMLFQRYLTAGSILELGPAEGIVTEILVDKYDDITAVDGSKLFCDKLQNRFPSMQVIHSLFEDYKPTRKFDNIILGHVLEHVESPCEILKKARSWLSAQGKIICVVPNSASIHRQAAVIMGLLESEKSLNEADIYHGHRRVYDYEGLCNDFLSAGLSIEAAGGYWLKPLANKQIEEYWTPEMIDAFMILGEKYPEIAAEIYIVAAI